MSSPGPLITDDVCSDCGVAYPDDAPLGLCPHCLLLSAKAHAVMLTRGPQLLTEPPLPQEIESLFSGQFKVEDLAGRGGMGAVYRAYQVRLDRKVAVKMLPPPNDDTDPEFPARFLQEAKALARLNHPNIVTLFDFGETAGHFYLIMEYVDGASLEAQLHDGPVDRDEALRIVGQVCEAIQYAHDNGVVHRDIKPGNILLTKEGTVKVADFGLAKVIDQGEFNLSLTWINRPLGTPLYMAPEQHADPLNTDHRADVYALGVLLYEMLTGRLPSGKFPPPSHFTRVDPQLDATVLKALEFEPAKRFQSVAALQDSLNQTSRHGGRHLKWWLWTAVALTTMMVLALLLPQQPEEEPRTFSTGRQPGKIIAFGSAIEPHIALITQVLQREDIVAVAASDGQAPFTLALTQEGKVVGVGEALPPVPDDLAHVVAIDAGSTHAIALTMENHLIIWNPTETRVIDDLPEIRQITAAGDLSVALTRKGNIHVWGITQNGQEIAFEESDSRQYVEIAASRDAVVALDQSGFVYVRGDPGSPLVSEFYQPGWVTDTVAVSETYAVGSERNSWLWGWGEGAVDTSNLPQADVGFRELLSGPSTSAARQTDGHWQVWGNLADAFPRAASQALALDFGRDFGLAVVRSEMTWEPPTLPKSLTKIGSFGHHESTIHELVLDEKSDRLWSLTDNAVRQFSTETQAESSPSFRTEENLTCMAYSSQKRQLAVSDSSVGKVFLLDADQFPLVTGTLSTDCQNPVTTLAYTPDGMRLAAGDAEGQIFLWEQEEAVPSSGGNPHGATVTSILFNSTATTITTTSWDRRVMISKTGTENFRSEALPFILTNNGQDLVQQPNGNLIAVSDWSGSVHTWPANTPESLHIWQAHREKWNADVRWLGKKSAPRLTMAICPHADWLVTGSGDRVVRLWNLASRQLLAQSSVLSQPVHALVVNSENEIIASGDNGKLSVWRYWTRDSVPE